jgi:hypothetical protein
MHKKFFFESLKMTLSGVKDCEKSANLFPQLRKASLASNRCIKCFFPSFLNEKPRFHQNNSWKLFRAPGIF